MELNRRNTAKIIRILIVVILFYMLMEHLGLVFGLVLSFLDVMFPLILGGCIAFIINIPMSGYERLLTKLSKKKGLHILGKGKRGVSILLAFISVLAVLTVVLVILIPQLGTTIKSIPDMFLGFWDRIVHWANNTEWVVKYVLPRLDINSIQWESIWNGINSYVFSGAGTVLSVSISLATSVFSGLIDFVLALCFGIYILAQKEKLGVQMKKFLYAVFKKDRADKFISFFALVSKVFSNFLTGQCIEALILGSMFFVSMTIFQFDYALSVSALIAVTALIPICGAFIGCAVGAFLLVMVSPVRAFWFVILFLILQQVEGNLIYPKVVGSKVGLPALWVLAAITIGGSLMGIVGMLIFVPLFSVIYVLIKEYVIKQLKAKRIKVKSDGVVESMDSEQN